MRRFAGLGAALLSLASGCYFSPPPLPDDPTSERPNLNLNAAVPPVFQVLNVRTGDGPVSFTIPFTSVDAGNDVWWFLYSNWNLTEETYETKGTLTTRPQDEDTGLGGAASTERSIQFTWNPKGVVTGCNQLTLFVTHDDNVDRVLDIPRDLSQAAIVTYWVNFNAPIDMGQTLTNCPLTDVGP